MIKAEETSYISRLQRMLTDDGWTSIEPSPYMPRWPDLLVRSPAGLLVAIEWKRGEGFLHFSAVANLAESLEELSSTYERDVRSVGLLITSQVLGTRLKSMAGSYPIIVVNYADKESAEEVSARIFELCLAIDGRGPLAKEIVNPDSKFWDRVMSGSSLMLRNAATVVVGRGDMQSARTLYERVLSEQIHSLGHDHPNTLATEQAWLTYCNRLETLRALASITKRLIKGRRAFLARIT